MLNTSLIYHKRLHNLLHTSLRIPVGRATKIVIMSDCHRGIGGWNDEFANNAGIYFAALRNYYEKGFTYIELGDGDDLWEEKEYCNIINQYSHIFWLLSMFHEHNRLYMIYGNHDIVKKKKKFIDKYLSNYYCDSKKSQMPLMPNLQMYESLVLEDEWHNRDILLLHGHQVDLFNSTFWPVARFLVRIIWRPLEFLGVNNPTMNNRFNYHGDVREDRLRSWANKQQQYLIAGHTHRPEHPKDSGYYFNSGSCVHPRCITALEIENGAISLVKWSIEASSDMKLGIEREVLEFEANDLYK